MYHYDLEHSFSVSPTDPPGAHENLGAPKLQQLWSPKKLQQLWSLKSCSNFGASLFSKIVRDGGPLREKDGLEEEVLDAGPLRLKVGLLEEVFETGPLRVRVGVAEEVLETGGEEVPVFVAVILLVAVPVDVVVRVELWDAVEAGDAVAVLEAAPDLVSRAVERTDLVEVVLGVGRRDAAVERVEVVVFVDVLDCVLVAVGTMPSARWATMTSVEFHGDVATVPIAARSKSHRILSTTGWRGYLRQDIYLWLIGCPPLL